MNKQQVVVVGGGETFNLKGEFLRWIRLNMHVSIEPHEGRGWKNNLQEDLGIKFNVINVKMPNPLYAEYDVWTTYFDRLLQFIEPGAMFVGHSLGGLFLLKYLNSHNLQPKATVFVSTCRGASADWGEVNSPGMLQNFGEVHIFHSKDDTIVDPRQAFLINSIFIDATMHLLSDRGHFIQDEHFPELVSVIRSVAKPLRVHAKRA